MEPPSFPAGGLQTVRAAPGSDATLVLPSPTGTPPFHFRWNRAGASLDDRFTASDDAGGVRLIVSAARTDDSGVYTLQASNAAGSDTARVRLEVSPEEAPSGDDPPSFLRRLQDLTVKVGTRTRFLVEIISSTECKVTWYRNERRLLEAERVSLARDGNFWCADLAAVSVDDAGRWTCTAENVGGRASCSAHLNVLVPKAYKRPEFVEELRALLTEQGTVSLECKVVGVPTPVLRWFKDSREIKAGDVFALTANAEDPTSLGTYTCEAVNCMGRAYSSSKVHVVGRGSREGSARPTSSSISTEPPPIFTKELEDQFVRVCEPLTLGCHVVVPPWPRSVVWYNKEGKVEPSERYHVSEDGVGGYLVEVGGAAWADEGEWKCVATSAGGRVGISTCYVTMDVPKNYRKPRFMENLQAVLTEEGLVSFECKVVGFPTPVLSWFKDGQELKPGDVYQLTGTNSLGSYCCIARNCMGQASSSAELTVEDIQNQLNEEEKLQLFSRNQAPKFVQGLKSVEAKIDEPYRFTVKVAIPPEPSVLWYRDDQPVDESSRCHLAKEDRGAFYLDIQNLEFLDQAEWKCVAMNDFGHSVTSCFLKLIIPRHYKKPRFLENLQAILSDEGAVNLECKVIGVPQPILKWYKDGEELKPGDIHRIISGQDGTCCLGTYTCEASNCMGIAASSASLLGFEDSIKAKEKKKVEEQALQRNLSLSTIHEERTSQMYDTPVGDITLDDKGEISFSFDGKEVSVSLYETPDLTEEEALQIVEMYADQLSENVTEHNVIELPPLRFVKETSTSGNLLMEAIIIDVSPEYFASPEEDLRTEADIEDISIADENGPPQLSLDQDADIGGEDYLEKTMALIYEEKTDIPLKLGRKKSDSQRSGDDYFSLSRDQSLSEEKRDDDTQALSESELQSFASAHSSGKAKSKSSKPSTEDGQESSEPTKTILIKNEVFKSAEADQEPPVDKTKHERRSSRSSRRSSSSSEKSLSKSKEEPMRIKDRVEVSKIPKMTDEEFKTRMSNVSSSLSKVINDVQIIERDIILQSELMSTAATASRSLEIISSLISPLSEIHSIADAVKESVSESKKVSRTLFNNLPLPLKKLQQSLTIVEKCIDVESDNKTLVKKTCVSFIETCGGEIQKLVAEVNLLASEDYLVIDDIIVSEIGSLTNEMLTVIKLSADTIKTKQLLSEASEIRVDEPSLEAKHLRDTQKAVFDLKSPLNSLLHIIDSADSAKIVDVSKIKNSEVILYDMSASIQDLQTALEQIELLSVKESTSSLYKYNTDIIDTVMESVLKLRGSFEQLSTDAKIEDVVTLKQTLTAIKENLNEIASHITTIERNIGTFDILQSDNKLDVLQKMAQILIALENHLPRLETIPEVKTHLESFHKKMTKVLENVIESNEAKKYFILMEICNAVNRVNSSMKNIDTENLLPLASLSNTLTIIQDYFIKNVFESELNCSILTNISDVLVGIQKAINKVEEISAHVDSEHVQDIMSTHVYDETKANVILEHIDKTIAAIKIVNAVETAPDLRTNIGPTFENICPILEELKHNIASVKAGVEYQDENVSSLSDESFAGTLATSLCELNQNIIVLNQTIVENVGSLKESSEIISAMAEPLYELHKTLEIIQQDIISQYGDDLTQYEVSVNMASAVHNLQSCMLMIQEQAGVEAVDDMSTLEDISGIKTTADTIPSDRLVLPVAEETIVEQTLEPLDKELPKSLIAQALHTLNEHVTVLQNPEIIDALDTLSEVSDYSNLKSVASELGELYTGIEEILHPAIMEGVHDLFNIVNSSKLTAVAIPMQELQQSLSVLDSNNIPVFENILELPTEKIHSVFETITDFKEHLDKCIRTIFPAIEMAEYSIEISNKVGTLRGVCEHLRDIIESIKAASDVTPAPHEVKALQQAVDSLLDATNVSKGIKIDQVKCITEELYEKVIAVQEELIQFTPQSAEKLAYEAKLIQTIDEVEKNIAVLEQYDFVDLSRASDMSCISLQLAKEVETESLMHIDDVVENAVNVIQDSLQKTPMVDLMIVDNFFKICENEFTILRCLILKPSSHKKIIRLLQEFCSLQSTINDFKAKRLELNLSDDINGCLATFLIHADDCLKSVQVSLVKIVDSQSELLFIEPISKLDSCTRLLVEIIRSERESDFFDVITKFVNVINACKPHMENVQINIIREIKDPGVESKTNENVLTGSIEEFLAYIETQIKSQANRRVIETLTKILHCIEKHHNYKDATGTGKLLILLKCLSNCADILQQGVLEIKAEEVVSKHNNITQEGALQIVLTEMLEPIQVLHSQLVNAQEQVLSGALEDTISIDVSSTDSLVQTMNEIHRELVDKVQSQASTIHDEEISLIMEIDKEVNLKEVSIKSMENVQAVEVVKEMVKPVEEIEKYLHSILPSESTSVDSKDKLPKEKAADLVHHIDQYIELIEIVEEISVIIKIQDLKESVLIAKELRENIAASETLGTDGNSDLWSAVRSEQASLTHKLQNTLSALQIQILDSVQEIAPELNIEVLQRIAKMTAQLQADLATVTGVYVAENAPADPIIENETAQFTSPLFSAGENSGSAILEQVGVIDTVVVSAQAEGTSDSLEKNTEETIPIAEEIINEHKTRVIIINQEPIAVDISPDVIEQTMEISSKLDKNDEDSEMVLYGECKELAADIEAKSLTNSDVCQKTEVMVVEKTISLDNKKLCALEQVEVTESEDVTSEIPTSTEVITADTQGLVGIEDIEIRTGEVAIVTAELLTIEQPTVIKTIEPTNKTQAKAIETEEIHTATECLPVEPQEIKTVKDVESLLGDIANEIVKKNTIEQSSTVETTEPTNTMQVIELREPSTVITGTIAADIIEPVILEKDATITPVKAKATVGTNDALCVAEISASTACTLPEMKEKNACEEAQIVQGSVETLIPSEDALFKATMVNLIQLIDKYVSKDIAEVIQEIAVVINIEQLKQSVQLAKELRNTIITLNFDTNEKVADVSKIIMQEQQVILAKQLQIALAMLNDQVLETVENLTATTNKDILQRVTKIAKNLHTHLVIFVDVGKILSQTQNVDPLQIAKDVQASTLVSHEESQNVVEHIMSTMDTEKCLEENLTVPELEESVALKSTQRSVLETSAAIQIEANAANESAANGHDGRVVAGNTFVVTPTTEKKESVTIANVTKNEETEFIFLSEDTAEKTRPMVEEKIQESLGKASVETHTHTLDTEDQTSKSLSEQITLNSDDCLGINHQTESVLLQKVKENVDLIKINDLVELFTESLSPIGNGAQKSMLKSELTFENATVYQEVNEKYENALRDSNNKKNTSEILEPIVLESLTLIDKIQPLNVTVITSDDTTIKMFSPKQETDIDIVEQVENNVKNDIACIEGGVIGHNAVNEIINPLILEQAIAFEEKQTLLQDVASTKMVSQKPSISQELKPMLEKITDSKVATEVQISETLNLEQIARQNFQPIVSQLSTPLEAICLETSNDIQSDIKLASGEVKNILHIADGVISNNMTRLSNSLIIEPPAPVEEVKILTVPLVESKDNIVDKIALNQETQPVLLEILKPIEDMHTLIMKQVQSNNLLIYNDDHVNKHLVTNLESQRTKESVDDENDESKVVAAIMQHEVLEPVIPIDKNDVEIVTEKIIEFGDRLSEKSVACYEKHPVLFETMLFTKEPQMGNIDIVSKENIVKHPISQPVILESLTSTEVIKSLTAICNESCDLITEKNISSHEFGPDFCSNLESSFTNATKFTEHDSLEKNVIYEDANIPNTRVCEGEIPQRIVLNPVTPIEEKTVDVATAKIIKWNNDLSQKSAACYEALFLLESVLTSKEAETAISTIDIDSNDSFTIIETPKPIIMEPLTVTEELITVTAENNERIASKEIANSVLIEIIKETECIKEFEDCEKSMNKAGQELSTNLHNKIDDSNNDIHMENAINEINCENTKPPISDMSELLVLGDTSLSQKKHQTKEIVKERLQAAIISNAMMPCEQVKIFNNNTKAFQRNVGVTGVTTSIGNIQITKDNNYAEESCVVIDEIKTLNLEEKFEYIGLMQQLDLFVSNEILDNIVEKISALTGTEKLRESVLIAKNLREYIAIVDAKMLYENTGNIEEFHSETAQLAQKLYNALIILHTKLLDSAQEITSMITPTNLQRLSEIISHLQDDLQAVIVASVPAMIIADEIQHTGDTIEENSMKRLRSLLKEVNNKIDLSSTEKNVEDTEALRDTLDEVQTVIIKLKRDYDGSVNDTLNETLEDLECSVRSVQLQINEESPPELLKEACATLQFLVNNMNETQEVQISDSISKVVKTDNILKRCSNETDKTIILLDIASKIDTTSYAHLNVIVSGLSDLKETIKLLKINFFTDAQTLIENGIDVVQSLDLIEDKVFSLEKDIDTERNLAPEVRDSIVTAIHSVYGSISNMRSSITSIQKQYMFENYGKPSEILLLSIKNVRTIMNTDNEDNQTHWKKFSKSLRQVLNHFEDIKFYINFDKTARLPSDAAFTKIILEELKFNMKQVVIPHAAISTPESTKKAHNMIKSLEKTLFNIESHPTLDVKEKIPIFKDIVSNILEITDFIKHSIQRTNDEHKKMSIELVTPDRNIITEKKTDDEHGEIKTVTKTEVCDERIVQQFPSTSKTQDVVWVTQDTEMVESYQESSNSAQDVQAIEKKAAMSSELVTAVATETVEQSEGLEELITLQLEESKSELLSQTVEPFILQETDINKNIQDVRIAHDAEVQLLQGVEKVPTQRNDEFRQDQEENVVQSMKLNEDEVTKYTLDKEMESIVKKEKVESNEVHQDEEKTFVKEECIVKESNNLIADKQTGESIYQQETEKMTTVKIDDASNIEEQYNTEDKNVQEQLRKTNEEEENKAQQKEEKSSPTIHKHKKTINYESSSNKEYKEAVNSKLEFESLQKEEIYETKEQDETSIYRENKEAKEEVEVKNEEENVQKKNKANLDNETEFAESYATSENDLTENKNEEQREWASIAVPKETGQEIASLASVKNIEIIEKGEVNPIDDENRIEIDAIVRNQEKEDELSRQMEVVEKLAGQKEDVDTKIHHAAEQEMGNEIIETEILLQRNEEKSMPKEIEDAEKQPKEKQNDECEARSKKKKENSKNAEKVVEKKEKEEATLINKDVKLNLLKEKRETDAPYQEEGSKEEDRITEKAVKAKILEEEKFESEKCFQIEDKKLVAKEMKEAEEAKLQMKKLAKTKLKVDDEARSCETEREDINKVKKEAKHEEKELAGFKKEVTEKLECGDQEDGKNEEKGQKSDMDNVVKELERSEKDSNEIEKRLLKEDDNVTGEEKDATQKIKREKHINTKKIKKDVDKCRSKKENSADGNVEKKDDGKKKEEEARLQKKEAETLEQVKREDNARCKEDETLKAETDCNAEEIQKPEGVENEQLEHVKRLQKKADHATKEKEYAEKTKQKEKQSEMKKIDLDEASLKKESNYAEISIKTAEEKKDAANINKDAVINVEKDKREADTLCQEDERFNYKEDHVDHEKEKRKILDDEKNEIEKVIHKEKIEKNEMKKQDKKRLNVDDLQLKMKIEDADKTEKEAEEATRIKNEAVKNIEREKLETDATMLVEERLNVEENRSTKEKEIADGLGKEKHDTERCLPKEEAKGIALEKEEAENAKLEKHNETQKKRTLEDEAHSSEKTSEAENANKEADKKVEDAMFTTKETVEGGKREIDAQSQENVELIVEEDRIKKIEKLEECNLKTKVSHRKGEEKHFLVDGDETENRLVEKNKRKDEHEASLRKEMKEAETAEEKENVYKINKENEERISKGRGEDEKAKLQKDKQAKKKQIVDDETCAKTDRSEKADGDKKKEKPKHKMKEAKKLEGENKEPDAQNPEILKLEDDQIAKESGEVGGFQKEKLETESRLQKELEEQISKENEEVEKEKLANQNTQKGDIKARSKKEDSMKNKIEDEKGEKDESKLKIEEAEKLEREKQEIDAQEERQEIEDDRIAKVKEKANRLEEEKLEAERRIQKEQEERIANEKEIAENAKLGEKQKEVDETHWKKEDTEKTKTEAENEKMKDAKHNKGELEEIGRENLKLEKECIVEKIEKMDRLGEDSLDIEKGVQNVEEKPIAKEKGGVKTKLAKNKKAQPKHNVDDEVCLKMEDIEKAKMGADDNEKKEAKLKMEEAENIEKDRQTVDTRHHKDKNIEEDCIAQAKEKADRLDKEKLKTENLCEEEERMVKEKEEAKLKKSKQVKKKKKVEVEDCSKIDAEYTVKANKDTEQEEEAARIKMEAEVNLERGKRGTETRCQEEERLKTEEDRIGNEKKNTDKLEKDKLEKCVAKQKEEIEKEKLEKLKRAKMGQKDEGETCSKKRNDVAEKVKKENEKMENEYATIVKTDVDDYFDSSKLEVSARRHEQEILQLEEGHVVREKEEIERLDKEKHECEKYLRKKDEEIVAKEKEEAEKAKPEKSKHAKKKKKIEDQSCSNETEDAMKTKKGTGEMEEDRFKKNEAKKHKREQYDVDEHCQEEKSFISDIDRISKGNDEAVRLQTEKRGIEKKKYEEGISRIQENYDSNGNKGVKEFEYEEKIIDIEKSWNDFRDNEHYIREYQYEPVPALRNYNDKERATFIEHNHKDYTMEFARPPRYRERTFDVDKPVDSAEYLGVGKDATIYKAQTIVLDSQLRCSASPHPDTSISCESVERRSEIRHRSKALSEARSTISEKRTISRDVKRKPVFSTYLTDRTAVEGSRVKLTCSVLSSTDPTVSWYKNGVLLDNKLKYRTRFSDGLITMEVLNAVPSDSAEYSCTVENENGCVSTSANLKVYPSFEASPIPPTFTRSIRDTYHLAENELVLECRIRGQPLPTITWLKDDKPINSNERYQAYYLADGVCRLAIDNPSPEDSGKYTCNAENSVWSDQITHVVTFTGKKSRLSPNLVTLEKSRFNRQALESRRPHFTNVLADYKVASGGTIGLQVEIRGCPTRVEWLREGHSVTEVYRNARTFVEQGLYTLALSDVTEKESGMYTCRAWSTHGNVDMNAAITVVQPNELDGKPAIIVGRPEKDILISVGEDVNISFRVQGEPRPKVVFMKGIRDITNNQRVCKMTSDDYVKFTLKRSVVSDAGTYCILVRNAYGCDRAFVTVVVRQRASSENLISDWTYPMDDSALSIAERKYKSVPDRIPGEPSVVDGGNNWVSLAWSKPVPRSTAPVLAYKIESWLLGKDGGARWVELGVTPLNSFDAFNLKQGEEYHFRVTPRNRYGWGESVQTSTPIGVGLAGDRPEFVAILPGQLKALAGETANLNCSVKGKPVPEVVWMKNGHEIEEDSRVYASYNGHDCSLTIKDIGAEDEARYSCEASNPHGRASTYARLAVVTDRLIWEADAKLKRERSEEGEGEYPPQFTMRLRDRRVQATYPVRLTCQVVGGPPPAITWFKDGDQILCDSRHSKYQDEHFHTLEIAPTTLEDGGMYEAMARNSSGAVSCRCSLVVDKGIRAYVAPEFCCGLEPLYRLAEGEELRISAVVEAYPSVGVTWYRDGVRLRPSRRAVMTLDRDGQIELALAAVTPRDAGVYTCTASNEVGRASTSGKVEVIGGVQTPQKRSPPLVISPDVPYSREPMFIRKPRSSEAREGDTVIIQCEVVGDPKPDVYWLRDFLKPDYYRDASHFKRVGAGPEYRCEIPHAKLDYTGAYSVVARNVHGEAKAVISLQILAKDPTSNDEAHHVRYGRVEVIPMFERSLMDLLSCDGDAVEFECRVTGNPEPHVRWFHYTDLIRECPDFETSYEGGAARLRIKQVTAEDEGTYTCEAANCLGKATSSACLVVYPPGEPNTLSQRLRRPPALLSAASTPRSTPRSTPARSLSRTPGPDARRLCSPARQMAPTFYTYPFNKVVEEGDHVIFQCAVKGLPAPWATWDKDGVILTPSARITVKEKDEIMRILEIEEVSIEDVGIYRITVENEFGRAEASARLEVITREGKFYGGLRAYSMSPRKSLAYRRRASRQD